MSLGALGQLKPKKCFVAYFDIMGFTDMVSRNDPRIPTIMELLSEYRKTVNILEKAYQDRFPKKGKRPLEKTTISKIDSAMFSDSILFSSNTDSPESAMKITMYSNHLLYTLLTNEIPVKGALAYGEFIGDMTQSKFYGLPLIDAYHLSEEIEFYGAVYHNSFEAKLKEINNEQMGTKTITKKVATKSGVITYTYLDWRQFLPPDTKNWEPIVKIFYSKTSGKPRRYIDNTLDAYSDDE